MFTCVALAFEIVVRKFRLITSYFRLILSIALPLIYSLSIVNELSGRSGGPVPYYTKKTDRKILAYLVSSALKVTD